MRNSLRSFPVGVAEELESYVYIYIDPRNDEVFYVGKGAGDRVFAHLKEADVLTKQSGKLGRIRDIWQNSQDVVIKIHRSGLTPDQAYHVEAAVIELFPDSENEVDGRDTTRLGARLVADLISERQREKAEINFPAVLINIRKEWLRIRPDQSKPVDPTQLYNSTRTAWEINPERHKNVRHAIAVAFGIIREVYQIENEWLRADVNADGSPRQIDSRWMFVGKPAADKQHLVGKAVDHLQKMGAQNPIKWLDKATSVKL